MVNAYTGIMMAGIVFLQARSKRDVLCLLKGIDQLYLAFSKATPQQERFERPKYNWEYAKCYQ